MSTMAARMTALVDVVPSFPCKKKAAEHVEGTCKPTICFHLISTRCCGDLYL